MIVRRPALLAVVALLAGLVAFVSPAATPAAEAAPATSWRAGDLAVVSTNSAFTGADRFPARIQSSGATSRLTLTTLNAGEAIRDGDLDGDGNLYLLTSQARVLKVAPDGTETVFAALSSLTYPDRSNSLVIRPGGGLALALFNRDTAQNDLVTYLANGVQQSVENIGASVAGLDADAAGNLYAVLGSGSTRTVSMRAPNSGSFTTLATYTSGGAGATAGQLVDVTVDSAGVVYALANRFGGTAAVTRLSPTTGYTPSEIAVSTYPQRSGFGGIAVTPDGTVSWTQWTGGTYQEGTTPPATLFRTPGANTASLSDVTSSELGASYYIPKVVAYPGPSEPAFEDAVDAVIESLSRTPVAYEPTQGSAGVYAPTDAYVTYSWKIGDTVVSARSEYEPRLADVGSSLTLTVTGMRQGYRTSTASAVSQPVGPAPGFRGDLQEGSSLSAIDSEATSRFTLFSGPGCTNAVSTVDESSVHLTAADVGLYVNLQQTVRGRTGTGTCEGPITEVTAPFPTRPSVTVTGTARVGSTLTATVGDGDPGAANTTKSYRWLADGVAITGAMSSTFVPSADQRGKAITVEVTSRARVAQTTYVDVTTSRETGKVVQAFGSSPSVYLAIRGRRPVAVGEVVEAIVEGGSPDAKGTTKTYQWYRDGLLVASATGSSYPLTAADEGAKISVTVTSSATDHVDDVTSSTQTSAIEKGTFTIGEPTVSGTTAVGNELSCAAAQGTPGTVSFEWFRGDSSVGTGSTYELVADDEDGVVTCVITAERGGYSDATNEADSGVVGAGTFAIGAPSISGSEEVGETLTCLAAPKTPGTVSFEWFRGESSVGTGSTYDLVAADEDGVVTCVVTAERDGYVDASNEVDSDVIAAGTFTIGAPTVSGTERVGEPLTCAAADGTPGTVSFEWFRGESSVGTGSTYDLVADDEGGVVTCVVTAEQDGYVDARNEVDSGVIGLGSFTIGAPSISGTTQVGETLTCAKADKALGSVSYEWFRGETPVGSGSTYALVADDEDEVVTCVVTAERDGYEDASNEVDSDVIAAGTFSIGAPSISGIERVGETLTCAAAEQTPGSVSYQWFRGEASVGTGSTYELVADDEDEVLTCMATAERDGYVDATNEVDSDVVKAGTFTIGAPTVTGTARVGETLTCASAPGTVGAVSYAWTRGGDPTVLASSAVYTATPGDLGATLRCTVTSVRDGYTDATAGADSGAVAAGAAGRYDVRVVGLRGAEGDEPRVRRPLQAALEGAAGAPTPSAVTWQWYADGVPVESATRARFNPGVDLLGARLRVVATVAADGYEQTTATGRVDRRVTMRPLVFAFDAETVRGGERVGLTATNLVPGQRWQLVSLFDDAVIASGTVGEDAEELTRSVRIPQRYAGSERVFSFRTTGPDRGVLDRITVR